MGCKDRYVLQFPYFTIALYAGGKEISLYVQILKNNGLSLNYVNSSSSCETFENY